MRHILYYIFAFLTNWWALIFAFICTAGQFLAESATIRNAIFSSLPTQLHTEDEKLQAILTWASIFSINAILFVLIRNYIRTYLGKYILIKNIVKFQNSMADVYRYHHNRLNTIKSNISANDQKLWAEFILADAQSCFADLFGRSGFRVAIFCKTEIEQGVYCMFQLYTSAFDQTNQRELSNERPYFRISKGVCGLAWEKCEIYCRSKDRHSYIDLIMGKNKNKNPEFTHTTLATDKRSILAIPIIVTKSTFDTATSDDVIGVLCVDSENKNDFRSLDDMNIEIAEKMKCYIALWGRLISDEIMKKESEKNKTRMKANYDFRAIKWHDNLTIKSG